MKTLHFIILLVALFLVALLSSRQRLGIEPTDRLAWSLAWNWVMTVTGGTFAAVSVLLLLQRGMAGSGIQQVLPLVIPLLGGLLIYQAHWALAVALALVVAAWSVLEFLRASKTPKKEE
jgi:hypothetical protein